MKRHLSLLAPVFAVFASVSSVHGATLLATQDTAIRIGTANTVDSTNNLVLTGNVGATDYIRGLYQFDLSSVTGETSSGSNLTFTITNTDASSVNANMTLSLHLVTATGVNVNAATWNNKAAGTPWATAGGDYDSTPLATLTMNPRSVTTYSTLVFSSAALDSLLTSTAASGGTLNFILVASGEGSTNRGLVRIGSREETYAANPVPAGPQLNFIPEPSSVLASCLGFTLLLVRRRK